MIIAILMSIIFPVFRAQGNESPPDNPPGTQAGLAPGPSSDQGTPVPPTPITPNPVPPAPASPDARIKELEGQLAGKLEELDQAGTRIAALEEEVAKAGKRTGELEGGLKKATQSYRNVLASANPDVLPELLNGDSIESLE